MWVVRKDQMINTNLISDIQLFSGMIRFVRQDFSRIEIFLETPYSAEVAYQQIQKALEQNLVTLIKI